MVNTNYENYNKPFHYLLSPSVWLDLDSFIYIIIVAIIVFGIVRIVGKCTNKRKMSFIDFIAKYMLLCSIPVFLLFFVQLTVSGRWIVNNVIITVLPLIYGLIIQLIFGIVKKNREKKHDKRTDF